MKTFSVTYLSTPVFSFDFNNGGKRVLILGGVHGDEIEGVLAAKGLMAQFLKGYDLKLNITVIPEFNADGVIFKTRTNAHGVDLNRNLPTKDWSPEIKSERYHPGPSPNSEITNQALVDWIDLEKPNLIISLHSWKPCLNINGNCRAFAEVISNKTGYEIVEDIGYSTPGCLGTYAGLERNIPTLTYEIERGLDPKNIQALHVPAILAALQFYQKD